MPSQGPNNPATDAVDTSFGTLGWTNLGMTYTSNNQYSYPSTSSASYISAYYLKVTNFGFSIPSGSIITGIVVEIERWTNSEVGYQAKDSRIRIIKGGTIQTTDLADTSTVWPNTDTYRTYGSSSELWGTTWTYTDINSSTFGVAISPQLKGFPGKITCYALIDHVRITVHYTTGGGGSVSRNQVIII